MGYHRVWVVSEIKYGWTNVIKNDCNYLYNCIIVDNRLCMFEIACQFHVLKSFKFESINLVCFASKCSANFKFCKYGPPSSLMYPSTTSTAWSTFLQVLPLPPIPMWLLYPSLHHRYLDLLPETCGRFLQYGLRNSLVVI